MYISKDKVINEVVNTLLKQGWVLKTKPPHARLCNPATNTTVTIPFTPSDHRARLNFLKDLRRYCGAEIEVRRQ